MDRGKFILPAQSQSINSKKLSDSYPSALPNIRAAVYADPLFAGGEFGVRVSGVDAGERTGKYLN